MKISPRAWKKDITAFYDGLYRQTDHFKRDWEGRIGEFYKLPKYVSIIADDIRRNFDPEEPIRILEVGAGIGEVSERLRDTCRTLIKEYVASEISEEGVKKLRERGFAALHQDAEDLSLCGDGSFDFVCAIDVMHHVGDPRRMAREMVRVSRKRVFLIEANGLCLIRKILERTSKYRNAGESSYAPWTYRSFFRGNAVREFRIKPFLFSVPFAPEPLIKTVIALSETLEKIPFLRWQGSGVIIRAVKQN